MNEGSQFRVIVVILFIAAAAAILFLLSDYANAENSAPSGPHGPPSSRASMQYMNEIGSLFREACCGQTAGDARLRIHGP